MGDTIASDYCEQRLNNSLLRDRTRRDHMTTARRDRYSGSIEKRGTSWRIRYWLPQDSNGKRKQQSETVRGTKKEANTLLRQRLAEIENGGFIPKDSQTVAQYMDYWMRTYVQTNTAPKTQQGYLYNIERHINPVLGGVELQKLNGQQIQGLYAVMLNDGLSNRTVLHCHRVLKGALRRAVTWEVLSRNPADAVSPPRPIAKNLQIWEVDTFQAFLVSAKDSPYLGRYKLAALTGMRRGELCGLKWDAVDLDAGHLRVTRTLQHIDGQGLVEGQPKTDRSRRTISLSAGALEVLRGLRVAQAEQRLSIGEVWRGTGHVFTTPIGTPIGGERVSKDFAKIVKQSDLPHLTFHGLRHTAASLMIAGGVHARTIADILGHSTITTTMDVYGHLLKGVQEEAVSILDGQLSGTL